MSTEFKVKEEKPDPEYDKIIANSNVKIKTEPEDIELKQGKLDEDPKTSIKTELETDLPVNILNNISNDYLAKIVSDIAIDIDPDLISNDELVFDSEESKSPLHIETTSTATNEHETDLYFKNIENSRKEIRQEEQAKSESLFSRRIKTEPGDNPPRDISSKEEPCSSRDDSRHIEPSSSQYERGRRSRSKDKILSSRHRRSQSRDNISPRRNIRPRSRHRSPSPCSSRISQSKADSRTSVNRKSLEKEQSPKPEDDLIQQRKRIREALESLDNSPSTSALNNSDMDLNSSNQNESQPSPMVLNVMPLPVKVKIEPRDDYSQTSNTQTSFVPIKRIKLEKSKSRENTEDQIQSDERQKVVHLCRDLIKKMSKFDTKFPNRFLYTSTAIVKPTKSALREHRSPLIQMHNIQFQFSSTASNLNTQQWGIHKLSEKTAKIVQLIGFDSCRLMDRVNRKTDGKGNLTNKPNESYQQSQTSIYISAGTQTDELKCHKCIIRKLKQYSDRAVQTTSSNTNIENLPIMSKLANLNSSEISAVSEFLNILKTPMPTNITDIFQTKEKLLAIVSTCQSVRPLNSAYRQSEYEQEYIPTQNVGYVQQPMQQMMMPGYMGQPPQHQQQQPMMNYPIQQQNNMMYQNSLMAMNPTHRLMRPDDPRNNRSAPNMHMTGDASQSHFSGYHKRY